MSSPESEPPVRTGHDGGLLQTPGVRGAGPAGLTPTRKLTSKRRRVPVVTGRGAPSGPTECSPW